MDYYEGQTELSVEDIFEHNVRSEMDRILRSSTDQFGTPTTESMTTFSTQHSANTEQPLPSDLANLNWLQGVDMTDFSHISTEAFQNHNLIVDPHTAIAVQMNGLRGVQHQQLTDQVQQVPMDMQVTTSEALPDYQTSVVTDTMPTNQLQQTRIQMVYPNTPVQPQNLQQPMYTTVPTTTMSSPAIVATTATTTHLPQQQPSRQQTGNIVTQPKLDKKNTENGQEAKVYPKPAYSYSCLIAMALKNSKTGCLPVSEIYQFMCENFPYFKTAPDGWKNSVRHNLSLNKCFEKIEKPSSGGSTRKGCLWALNPNKAAKMDDEIQKWRKKDPIAIRRSSAKPDELDQLERGRPPSPSPPVQQTRIPEITHKAIDDHITTKTVSDVLFNGEAQLLDVNLDPQLTDISLQAAGPPPTTSSYLSSHTHFNNFHPYIPQQ
ncbi:uncharacterized protein LOC144433949 isoform X2 [Glandiceps talaboti]